MTTITGRPLLVLRTCVGTCMFVCCVVLCVTVICVNKMLAMCVRPLVMYVRLSEHGQGEGVEKEEVRGSEELHERAKRTACARVNGEHRHVAPDGGRAWTEVMVVAGMKKKTMGEKRRVTSTVYATSASHR